MGYGRIDLLSSLMNVVNSSPSSGVSGNSGK
jgi:hypothetical protein